MEIDRYFAIVFVVGVVVVHVDAHGAWAIQRNNCGHVFKGIGCKRLEQRAHWRTFELEYTDGVATSQKIKRLRVAERHRIDIEVGVVVCAHHRHGVGDDVEVAQTQEVHFEQTQSFNAMHFVLRDNG